MDGGPAPEGIAEAASPAHPVGSEVTLTADHMPGMDGATATITGAFDTTTYSVDYTPTTGGDPVTDHQWVVQEELENPGEERLADGTEVTVTADHMEGMDGANAMIAGAYDTYTYAVDFTPSAGGEPVKDHKWVVQQEIKDAGDERLADGTEVTLEAEHMEGMKGAKATIASSTEETVYMVDYESDGMTMTNHKWVVESELKPAS